MTVRGTPVPKRKNLKPPCDDCWRKERCKAPCNDFKHYIGVANRGKPDK